MARQLHTPGLEKVIHGYRGGVTQDPGYMISSGQIWDRRSRCPDRSSPSQPEEFSAWRNSSENSRCLWIRTHPDVRKNTSKFGIYRPDWSSSPSDRRLYTYYSPCNHRETGEIGLKEPSYRAMIRHGPRTLALKSNNFHCVLSVTNYTNLVSYMRYAWLVIDGFNWHFSNYNIIKIATAMRIFREMEHTKSWGVIFRLERIGPVFPTLWSDRDQIPTQVMIAP